MGLGYDYFKDLLKRYHQILQQLFGGRLVSLAVYGSVARGEASTDSDIDVALILEDGTPDITDLVTQAQMELELTEEYRVLRSRGLWPTMSCLALTRSGASESRWIFLDMAEDAVLLADSGDFLRNRFDRLRQRLRELGSRKIALPDKSWYWNLKPDLHPGEVFEL